MKLEDFEKAKELTAAIEKVKELINNVNNPYVDMVTFYASGNQSKVVTTSTEDLEVIKAVLLGLHTTKLVKLEAEFKAL